MKITPFNGKIQDKDEAYYKQFQLIVCGLDSIEARRWINSMLVDMVDESDPESLKPLIDGGTEGEFLRLRIAKYPSKFSFRLQRTVESHYPNNECLH